MKEKTDIKPHKNLDVWKKSIKFVTMLYEIVKELPKDEVYGLNSQIKRSAISISSNIAEWAARQGNKEFKRFLYIARGSLGELDTQLEIAKRLNFLQEDKFEIMQQKLNEIGKMLNGLIKSLK